MLDSLPAEVVEAILSVIPPYPYHFTLRLVSKNIKNIVENYVNPQFCFSHIFSPPEEEFQQILDLYKNKKNLELVELVSLPADLNMEQEEFVQILSMFPNCKKLIIPFYRHNIDNLIENLELFVDLKVEHLSFIGAYDCEVKKYKKVSSLRKSFPQLKTVEVTFNNKGINSMRHQFFQYKRLRSLNMNEAIYLIESGINVNMPISELTRDELTFTLMDLACGRWDPGDISVVKLMVEIGGDIDKSLRPSTWSKLIERCAENEFNEDDILLYLCGFMRKLNKPIWTEMTFPEILHAIQCISGDFYFLKTSIYERKYEGLVEVMDYLVKNDLIIFDFNEMFHHALHSEELFQFFKKQKVNLNKNCSENLFHSLSNKYNHAIEALLKTDFDVNFIDEKSQTLLHAAIKSNLFDEAELLIDMNPKEK
eukprot:gene7005-11170_t